jgi:hypothetical protein
MQNYLLDIYAHNEDHRMLDDFSFDHSDPSPQITTEDITKALKHLSKNKALGLDGLKDTQIHEYLTIPNVLLKVSTFFTNSLTKGSLPSYFKTARVVPISKTSSPFPPYPDIRTLAILPAITKLYEQCILTLLQKEITERNLLSDSQKGFRAGTGCIDNIIPFLELM